MKKIIAFVKKYQLIIILAIVAGLMLSIKLFLKTEVTPEEKTPVVSPTIVPTLAPSSGEGMTEEQFIQDIMEQFPLAPFLPYPGDKFEIKYTGPLSLEITTTEKGSVSVREEAIEWIESKNVDPQTHQIVWK